MNPEAAKVLPTEEAKIAERLKSARLALGLTQAQLAAKAGLSRSAVVHYEKKKAVPGGLELIKLAKALDQSPNRLLSGVESFFDSEKTEYALVSDNLDETAVKMGMCLMALDRETQERISSLLMALVKARMTAQEFAEFVDAMKTVRGTIAALTAEIEALAAAAERIITDSGGKR